MASLYESSMGYGLVYSVCLASCSYSVSSEIWIVYSHNDLHYYVHAVSRLTYTRIILGMLRVFKRCP